MKNNKDKKNNLSKLFSLRRLLIKSKKLNVVNTIIRAAPIWKK